MTEGLKLLRQAQGCLGKNALNRGAMGAEVLEDEVTRVFWGIVEANRGWS